MLEISPSFYVTIPPGWHHRRLDIFSKLGAIMNYYVSPKLGASVPISVVWAPVLKEGQIHRDRIMIGTYGPDQFADLIIPLIFASSPVEPFCFVLNGSPLIFSHYSYASASLPKFPSRAFSVDVIMDRISKVCLDYARDMVFVAGIPPEELLDVIYTSSSIIIVLSKAQSARVLLERFANFRDGDEWTLRLAQLEPLPPMPLRGYTPLAAELLNQEYPSDISEPVLYHGQLDLFPLNAEDPLEGGVPPAHPPTRRGPICSPLTFKVNGTLRGIAVSSATAASAMQNLSLSSREPSISKRSRLQMDDYTMWESIRLATDPLTADQAALLKTVLLSHIPNSTETLLVTLQEVLTSISMQEGMELDV
jgi:hypothetical protein